ncbi:ribosomal protein S18-alanine N-acetyltransferase [Halorubrum gandharaense]
MTPVETAIREVERADLLAVQRIETACFSDPWPFEAFERFLEEPAFLVAERAPVGTSSNGATGEIVGYVVADSTPNFGRDIGHVKDLAVAPDARGEGVGRALLRAALLRLHAQGAAVVKLEVRTSNEAARSLYADEGFEPLRRVPRYYPDGEDALVLVVDLDQWVEER